MRGRCPRCGSELENYTDLEGGWCPRCQEWFPSDVVRESMEEED
jgi:predicted amidophosphoribosyltransferase